MIGQKWKGVVFDLDGTLVDSALDFDAMRREMGLPDGQPILEGLALIPPGSHREHCLAVLGRHERDGADRSEWMPGAMRFVERLRRCRTPIAVLTRNSRESTDRVISRLEMPFSPVLTREDAAPKPDPSGLLSICRTWDVPPGEVLFFGDYLFDLRAGANAGTKTALYVPGELPDYAHEADFLVRHFDEAHALVDWSLEESGDSDTR